MNNFRRIFNPTKEEELEDLNRYLNICKSCPDCCDICEHYHPADLYLPGFVTDYGSCKIHPELFKHNKIGCKDYIRSTESETNLQKRIDELKAGDKNEERRD